MKKLWPLLTLMIVTLTPLSASALTLPDDGSLYFTASTTQLYKIRAAMAVLDCEDNPQIQLCVYTGGGNPPSCSWSVNPHCNIDTISAPFSGAWQVLGPPWGMGAVDCMRAYESDTVNYMGRTALVDGESVTVPEYTDLVSQTTWPGQCYGYQFHFLCGNDIMGPIYCADPEP